MFPQRKHIRLKDFDYSSAGYYFITICTKNKKHFFGSVENEKISLNEIGQCAFKFMNAIPVQFPNAQIDEFVVMPNHVHCILILNETESNIGVQSQSNQNQFAKPVKGSVSVIIQQYKSLIKKWCNKSDKKYFEWQSRFFDRVIRNDEEYKFIKQYITDNPSNWNADRFYNEDL